MFLGDLRFLGLTKASRLRVHMGRRVEYSA